MSDHPDPYRFDFCAPQDFMPEDLPMGFHQCPGCGDGIEDGDCCVHCHPELKPRRSVCVHCDEPISMFAPGSMKPYPDWQHRHISDGTRERDGHVAELVNSAALDAKWAGWRPTYKETSQPPDTMAG
jgi:hypothetical protein